MLKAFADDSGSGGDSVWSVLAGYVGTVDAWDRFDSPWQDALHRHPRIEYFKASEAESLRPDGQWAGITERQRDEKINSLIDVIGQHARRPVCVRLKQIDYDEIIKGNIPPAWDSPYYIMLPILAGAIINIERLDGEGESVHLVLDRDDRHQRKFGLLRPAMLPMAALSGKLVNVTREDDKEFLPLQAADLLAWQIRRFWSTTGEAKREHFTAATSCASEEYHQFFLKRKQLQFIMTELKNAAVETALERGVSPDLRTWP